MTQLTCFKAYDIRGRLPEQLNEFMVYCIGKAYARIIKPTQTIAVGKDIRLSSQTLSQALMAGLNSEGVATVDIGLCGTEMIYFAAGQDHMGGGIMVTASHNPAGPDDDFGIKYNTSNGGPAPEKITDAIFANSKNITQYTLADLPEVDLSSIGVTTLDGFEIEVIDSVAD